MSTTRTLITLDATAFAEFLEHMASHAEMTAADENATKFTEAYATGAATAYRSTLETVVRMVEDPTNSPFAVES